MERIDITELKEIASQTLLLPRYHIISPWKDRIECPVCLQIKINGSVIHRDCMRIVCASCALCIIDSGSNNCPTCRGDITDRFELESQLNLMTLPPNDKWLFDNLNFGCPPCKAVMQREEAYHHDLKCSEQNIFLPPHYLWDWFSMKRVRRDTFSNPIIQTVEPRSKERLIVMDFNGRQILSKFVSIKKDTADLLCMANKQLEKDIVKLRPIMFFHRELDPTTRIDDIARHSGAHHISIVEETEGISGRIASISLNDFGPSPFVAKEVGPRGHGRL